MKGTRWTARNWTVHRIGIGMLAAGLVAAGLGALSPPAALAADEPVNIWLTTTSDAGGRTVTRGLQPQTPGNFGPPGGAADHVIGIDEGTTYQQFEGAGASITDSTAWLLRGSGIVSPGTRDAVMRDLFDPVNGIGLNFLRNPMGASDLARHNYNYDDTCCDLNDFSLAADADVIALTAQAQQLNPAVVVKGVPWSAPGWMKDNGTMTRMGWLKWEYYPTYAQYFVKYIQGYAARGITVDYVSVQNEPNCCGANSTYPTMSWNASGLVEFTKNHLYPAFRAAGITTKVMVHDWNYGDYGQIGSGVLADAGVRNDPLFGGIAWHGYFGDVATGSQVHDQYPNVKQYSTEHSGGTWVSNQHAEDMRDIVSYARNWSRSVVKWSLALDQNHNPHNGGCNVCTGLITVHNGDGQHGQVEKTIEFYTTGHLTKFVKPGAYRIASTADNTIPNVAWKNPDGSKALIAYNPTTGPRTIRVDWGGQSFRYDLPARTSATFTWSGTAASAPSGPISGLGGKCVDVAGAATADGTRVQLYTCNGTAAQRWTIGSDGTVRALGKCLDVSGGSSADGTRVQLWSCNGTAAQRWTIGSDGTVRALGKCLDVTGWNTADGTPLQIWSCTGGANQKWTVPA
ncbi:MAG: lectin [Micromonosporaceae bacterium]